MPGQTVDRFPLTNRSVVVAASPEKSKELREGLERLGATVLEARVSVIRGIQDSSPLDTALRSLGQYNWILFTSVHGVQFFFQRMTDLGLAHLAPALKDICAIGPATAARLESLGMRVSLIPEDFVSEGVLRALATRYGGEEKLRGLRFLLPGAREGRDLLPRTLAAAGAFVHAVPCYESVPAELDEMIRREIAGRPPDLLVFTSPSNVRNFVAALGDETGRRILAASRVAALGPVTTEAVRSFGAEVHIRPKANTIRSLLDAVARHFVTGREAT